jgi:spore germination protein
MDIYVVQPGDTIDTIANSYGVSVDKLIQDNELTDPDQLVPGETIVIVYPSQTYTVQEGDTLETIAASYNVSITELLRNNPAITENSSIYPGEVITISYNRTGNIATHGYTNTFIDRKILRKTLPYLTYLTIFNYRTIKNGDIMGSEEDIDIIQLAKDYGVIPLMLITTLSVQGEVDIELTYEVLINEELQNRLFDNVLHIVKERGYYGVNISAQFINAENQSLFNVYTKNLSDRLRQEGYLTVITINPRIETVNNDVTFENIDYTNIMGKVDSALFLQYKWGYSFGPPSPVSSIANMNVFFNYILHQVPPEKIFVGIPTLGYDWELPYVPGFSRASALTIESVMRLARVVGAIIQFDERSQTPYFRYENMGDNAQHEVWFVNALTFNSLINMLKEKGILGSGIWNIMTYFTQLWLVINSQYEIIKLIPEF